MASILKIKRSSVKGKAPSTSDIATGEIALNTRDGKFFSSDGSNVFELGANTATSRIGTLTVGNTNPFTLPSSDGTAGQILKTDGSGNITFQDGGADQTTATVTTNTPQKVDSFPKANFRSAKYVAQVSNLDGFQVSEILIVHRGTTVDFSQYGDVVIAEQAKLGDFSAALNGANVELRFAPTTDSFVSTVFAKRELVTLSNVLAFPSDTDLDVASLGILDMGSVADASIDNSQDLNT
jgi:hypothetical protein